MEDPREPWASTFAVAVLEFGLSAADAWNLTPPEWWMLYDAKMRQQLSADGALSDHEALALAQELEEMRRAEEQAGAVIPQE